MSRDEVTTRRRTGYCLLTFVNSGEGVKGMENWRGYPSLSRLVDWGTVLSSHRGVRGRVPVALIHFEHHTVLLVVGNVRSGIVILYLILYIIQYML